MLLFYMTLQPLRETIMGKLTYGVAVKRLRPTESCTSVT